MCITSGSESEVDAILKNDPKLPRARTQSQELSDCSQIQLGLQVFLRMDSVVSMIQKGSISFRTKEPCSISADQLKCAGHQWRDIEHKEGLAL